MGAGGPGSAEAIAILQRDSAALTEYFQRTLKRLGGAPSKLIEAIEYSLLAGGKRLRPALVLECFRACAGPVATGYKSALAAAAAIELVHTFSLVHDDLPAMDDDDLRRGKPTNHKVFGEAMAILAGDAMLALAFEIVAADSDPALCPKLVIELSRAAGAAGMIGGQVLDIAAEHQALDLPQLRQIHNLKTGAMLTASCRMGAICASADDSALEAVTEFGRHLGLAFQIVDDILDVTSTPAQLGKRTRKDSTKGKNTYPALLGLEQSKSAAESHLQSAIAALKPLDSSATGLMTLARFVAQREA